MKNFSVDIVLAAYNGVAYIDVLIESILSQNFLPIKIYARDDDSSDCTPEKLYYYEKNSNRFHVIKLDKNIGVIKNFELLLQNTNSDYIMLADQDDFWFPDKISRSVEGIRKIESEVGSGEPLVFFTNLQVVDQNLKKISNSFWEYENLKPEISQFLQKLIVRNVSPGCSMIVNRALLKRALPFPKGIVMHDWWLILTALVLGKVGYSEKTTMNYRQHDENVKGAKKQSISKKVFDVLFKYQDIKHAINQTQDQAKLLLDRFGDEMKENDLEILKAYSNSRKENKMIHKYRCYKNGISSNGLLSNIGLYLLI